MVTIPPASTKAIRSLAEHAVFMIRQNDFRMAVSLLDQSLQLDADNPESLLLKAQCHHALGEVQPSEACFGKLLGLDPDNGFIHHCLAILFNDHQRAADALHHAKKAVALDPAHFEYWVQLSLSSRCCGMLDAALTAAEKAISISGGHPDALKARAYAQLYLGRTEPAFADFRQCMLAYFSGNSGNGRQREFTQTSKAKLWHDIEQYRYLSGKFGEPVFRDLAERHTRLLGQLPDEMPGDEIVSLGEDALRGLNGAYNRLHRFVDAERMQQSAINPSINFDSVESDYARREPGITWIDEFLSAGALQALRTYCLENTFWFDFHHPNGYLGALMENGFAAPLLGQIAQELRTCLPGIFKDHPLIQMWAFKYDSRLQGIQMHADVAAVNMNFWITLDDANLDAESGGLVIWDKKAPASWAFSDFNTAEADRQQRVLDFLAGANANRITVPYKANRAVLFNSDLFHCTDTIHFKEGYENRRINITLLFGHR